MAGSDSAIAAAAGLGGALIGGLSAFLAGRVQWRRESRRELYAELLTAAHDVRGFLEGLRRTQRIPVRAQFLVKLDAASLLASWKVQEVLDHWRPLAVRLHEDQELGIAERREIIELWNTYQNRFQEQAKLELRIRDKLGYRRLAYVFLGFTFAVGFTLVIPAAGKEVYDRIDMFTVPINPFDFDFSDHWTGALILSLVLLILGARAARRADSRILLNTMVLYAVWQFLVVISLSSVKFDIYSLLSQVRYSFALLTLGTILDTLSVVTHWWLDRGNEDPTISPIIKVLLIFPIIQSLNRRFISLIERISRSRR
jgi:hypothetical protein